MVKETNEDTIAGFNKSLEAAGEAIEKISRRVSDIANEKDVYLSKRIANDARMPAGQREAMETVTGWTQKMREDLSEAPNGNSLPLNEGTNDIETKPSDITDGTP